jgi:hypothetical protein
MNGLAEAYSRLSSLKDHLPQIQFLGDTYINEYHEVLTLLEKTSGADLSGFRLTKSLQPVPHTNASSGKIDWTYLVDQNVLLMKADALLCFFQATSTQKPASPIGFHPPGS